MGEERWCLVGVGLRSGWVRYRVGVGRESGRSRVCRESGVGRWELGLGRCPLVVRGYGLGVACRV